MAAEEHKMVQSGLRQQPLTLRQLSRNTSNSNNTSTFRRLSDNSDGVNFTTNPANNSSLLSEGPQDSTSTRRKANLRQLLMPAAVRAVSNSSSRQNSESNSRRATSNKVQ